MRRAMLTGRGWAALALAALALAVFCACSGEPDNTESSANAALDSSTDAAGAVGADDAGQGAGAGTTGDGSGGADAALDVSGGSDGGGGIGGPGSAQPLPGQATSAKGKTDAFAFEVPPGKVAFALNASAEAHVFLAFEALTDPDGEVLIADGWIEQDFVTGGQICVACKVRVAPQQGATALLVPNAPGVVIKPGTWTVRARAWTQTQTGAFSPPKKTAWQGEVALSLATQVAAAPPTASQLDLNLFWSGAQGLTAQSASADAKVAGWLSRLGEIYAGAGIAIGTVRHYDLEPGFEVVEAMAADNADFAALGAATAAAPAGLSFAMVREITSPFGAFGAVLGISGGIPGPVLVPGTARAIVVVSMADLPKGRGSAGGVHDVGLTMAHEGGHYLGLFHTSENTFGGLGPKLEDPLPDTSNPATDNLMHFDGGSGGAGLSAQQGTVLRSNPVALPTGKKGGA